MLEIFISSPNKIFKVSATDKLKVPEACLKFRIVRPTYAYFVFFFGPNSEFFLKFLDILQKRKKRKFVLFIKSIGQLTR